METAPKINGVSVASVYVHDYEAAFAFYTELLGLDKSFDTGELACFFGFSREGSGLYLEGGHKRANTVDPETARASFALDVNNARTLFDRLKENGTQCVQEQPLVMQEGQYWFQFYDPDDNLIEILGGG